MDDERPRPPNLKERTRGFALRVIGFTSPYRRRAKLRIGKQIAFRNGGGS
jgi:hypothetical protein